jgi:hypothetical protein
MQRNCHLAICLALVAAVPSLHADVTLRYETRTTLNPSLPPQIAEVMMKSLSMTLPEMSAQQFRNGKLFYSQAKLNLIVDTAKREITMIDSLGRRYATVPADQYGSAISGSMPEVPGQARSMPGSMKIHAESAPGGATATIQGIQAEDHALVFTIDGPTGQGLPGGPMVRMTMHMWLAKGSEALRVQALREVSGYNLMAMEALSPVATIQKMFQQFSGMGDAFAGLQKDLIAGGGSVMLRMQLDMFVPMMAALTGQAASDPNAPFVQITQELAQISTEAVPDSVFQVPDGYQAATVAEILQATTAGIATAPAPK